MSANLSRSVVSPANGKRSSSLPAGLRHRASAGRKAPPRSLDRRGLFLAKPVAHQRGQRLGSFLRVLTLGQYA
jgi:hypothetical protein